MDKDKNYSILKKTCLGLGAELFGIADIEEAKEEFDLSKNITVRADKAVCLGIGLSAGVLSDISKGPTRLYFHHYRTVNICLDQIALKVAGFIQRKGFLAVPIPASQIVDWENQKAHLSHKKIGFLAGLGWIGRNNLLVNKRSGSQFRLVSILTDFPAKTDKPLEEGCGSCRLCIDVCPAQAIGESMVKFDHLKCFNKLKEFQKQRLVDQYVCGICVKVCKGKLNHEREDSNSRRRKRHS